LFQPDRQQRQPLTDVVVQIARDARPLGFLGLEQATAHTGEDFLGMLARRDIRDHSHHPHQTARVVEVRPAAPLDPYQGAVRPVHAIADEQLRVPRVQCAQCGQDAIPIVAVNPGECLLAGHRRLGIDAENVAGFTRANDGVGGHIPGIREHLSRFGGEPQTLFAVAQRLLCLLALGNVAAHADVIAPVLERDRLDVDLHRKDRPVFSPVHALEQRETCLFADSRDFLERGIAGVRIDVLHGQRQQLFTAVAQLTTGLVVDVEESPGRAVDDLERIVGAVEQVAEQIERLFTLLAFRDVLDRAAKPGDAAIRVTLRFTARRDPLA
jgi:hypothetical protein